MKHLNKHVDPQLPRGDFPGLIRGRRFTFLDFRMGDRAYFSYELGHLGCSAVCPCLWCYQRYGKFGLCVNDSGTDAQRFKRTDAHYDRMAAIAKPFSEFKPQV
jgi:hypothetical protein